MNGDYIVNNPLYLRFGQVVQSLLQEAEKTTAKDFQSNGEGSYDAEFLGQVLDTCDRCAACDAVTDLERLGHATCRNGHQWCKLKRPNHG